MIGAILGDMIGAPYEFDQYNIKTKDFPLFSKHSQFTDDTVMTVAVAKAFLSIPSGTDDDRKKALVREMQSLGACYPYAGYGGMFSQWLEEKNPKPYHSFGNGSAMRVSSVPLLFPDHFEQMRHMARLSAWVTHNHPEGLKGADATACVIWMAHHGFSKKTILAFVESEFGYDLHRTCDMIRPTYHHVETCQETVPQAIIAFLESTGFEDGIRLAVSLGGDSDTLACICGGMLEGYYGVPEELKEACKNRLPEVLWEVVKQVEGK